ncbi:MAG TPA: cyclase family protein [Acidimicrobiales bacterium]
MTSLPAYDDLPFKAGAPVGSSWGLWGDDDVFGCLNLLTAERVVGAARLVRKGAVFALNLDAGLPDPPFFGRAGMEHTVLGDRRGHDDLLSFNTQSSSQWDGFRHIGGPHGFYNGIADEAHGMHHWARRGIAGRGVLADVARWREAAGRPLDPSSSDVIEPADVDATLEAQGVAVQEGDVLLLRTGWLTAYRSLDDAARRKAAEDLRAPGLAPGRATAKWLWDHHVAAVAADNPAVEVLPIGAGLSPDERRKGRDDPDRGPELFVHLALLPLLGIPLGELWDLDALADDCAADGVYEFFLTSAPLHVEAGVASPPNALAIK